MGPTANFASRTGETSGRAIDPHPQALGGAFGAADGPTSGASSGRRGGRYERLIITNQWADAIAGGEPF